MCHLHHVALLCCHRGRPPRHRAPSSFHFIGRSRNWAQGPATLPRGYSIARSFDLSGARTGRVLAGSSGPNSRGRLIGARSGLVSLSIGSRDAGRTRSPVSRPLSSATESLRRALRAGARLRSSELLRKWQLPAASIEHTRGEKTHCRKPGRWGCCRRPASARWSARVSNQWRSCAEVKRRNSIPNKSIRFVWLATRSDAAVSSAPISNDLPLAVIDSSSTSTPLAPCERNRNQASEK